MAQDITKFRHDFTTDRDKRKATQWEIEGAKQLRSIKHEKLPDLVAFLQDTYFDIQDNWIDDIISDKIRKNLIRYRATIPKAQELARNIHTVPRIKHGKQTMLDIHMNILRYSANFEIKQKGLLSKRDIKAVLNKVCEYYDFDIEAVESNSRKHEYVTARALTSLICEPKSSLTLIGNAINRKHSSVINIIKKLKKEMGDKPQLKQDYLKLRAITGL